MTDASNSTAMQEVEGMRLRFVHCAARSTPAFVVNVMKIVVQTILTCAAHLWAQSCLLGTTDVSSLEQREQIWSCVVCSVGKGLEGFRVDLGSAWGASQG